MKSRVGAFALCVLLAISIACNKPNQSADNSATPDNSQPNGSPAGSQTGNSQLTPPAPVAVTVPSGKTLTVRLADEVGSKVSQPGQSFGGSLANSVQVNGETVIPAGARVQGVVVDAKPLGRFAGGA